MYVTWFIHVYHWCTWHDSVTLVNVGETSHSCTHSYMWHNSWMYVTSSFIIYDVVYWWMRHWWFIYMTGLIDVRDMTHLYSLVYVTWSHPHWCMWRVTCSYTHSYTWHDSWMCAAWLSHIHDVTPWCMWHDSFIIVCDMTHSHIWHDAWIYVTWCNMTPWYMWHHTSMYVARLIHIYDITHWFMWDDSCMWDDYYIYSVTWSHHGCHPRFASWMRDYDPV